MNNEPPVDFCSETNKTCKSDWIYIKDTLDRFYQYDQAQVKFSPVYLDGKGNYMNKEREINSLIFQYRSTSKNNKSEVIYCFDCDDYDSKQEDMEFLNTVQQYCKNRKYNFVWFCKDVERVYIGKMVENSQKKKEAATFKAKKLIANVDARNLSADHYKMNTSNIMKVLDLYLERK